MSKQAEWEGALGAGGWISPRVQSWSLCPGTTYLPALVSVLGTLNNSSSKTLHSVVLVFLALGLFSSLLSAGFTFYNSVSNPYQTFLGPMGVYTWSGLSGQYRPVPASVPLVPSHEDTHGHGRTLGIKSVLS